LFFFGDALFTAFISLYLVSIDLNALEKGIVLGLVPIGLFLGNLFYSRFAKSYKDNIRLLKIISLIEGLLILFFGFIKNFYVICVFAF
jgi:predicted MFS family arabinose efflux permease